MARLANFSGQEVARLLEKRFGFFFVSQKGSHIKLRRIASQGSITVIVPAHPELASGTLRGVLKQAQVDTVDFLSAFGR